MEGKSKPRFKALVVALVLFVVCVVIPVVIVDIERNGPPWRPVVIEEARDGSR